jgi:hypothetical protein
LYSQIKIQQNHTNEILSKSRSVSPLSPPVRDSSPPFLKKQILSDPREDYDDDSNRKILIRTSSVPSQISTFKPEISRRISKSRSNSRRQSSLPPSMKKKEVLIMTPETNISN